jgi:hypothetical protein
MNWGSLNQMHQIIMMQVHYCPYDESRRKIGKIWIVRH